MIENELVDYLRIDMVHAGGITEAKKILALGEVHGQRSALHHASSPVNGVACLHVDMAVPNFGIQEWMELEPLYELFPNAPRAHGGLRGAAVRARASASSSTRRRRAGAPPGTPSCPTATGPTAAAPTTRGEDAWTSREPKVRPAGDSRSVARAARRTARLDHSQVRLAAARERARNAAPADRGAGRGRARSLARAARGDRNRVHGPHGAGTAFRAAGAIVDDDTGLVRIPREVVERRGRDRTAGVHRHPARARPADSTPVAKSVAFGLVAGPPTVQDRVRGRRQGNLDDYITLAEARAELRRDPLRRQPADAAGRSCRPRTRHLDTYLANVTYTDRAFHCLAIGRDRVIDAIEITAISRGLTREQVVDDPCVFTIISVNSHAASTRRCRTA